MLHTMSSSSSFHSRCVKASETALSVMLLRNSIGTATEALLNGQPQLPTVGTMVLTSVCDTGSFLPLQPSS